MCLGTSTVHVVRYVTRFSMGDCWGGGSWWSQCDGATGWRDDRGWHDGWQDDRSRGSGGGQGSGGWRGDGWWKPAVENWPQSRVLPEVMHLSYFEDLEVTCPWREHNIALKYARHVCERRGHRSMKFMNTDPFLVAPLIHV